MKSSVLNIILAIAVVVLSVRLVCVQHTGKATDTADVVYQNILTRTSVRSYQDKAVDSTQVERLLRAGMAAPSAMNTQPWHFVVVQDKALLEQIADATPNAGMAKNAPLAIVVCGDLQKEKTGWEQAFWIQDVSAVTENILLQAHAMGLGAVWTGTYPSEERCQAVSRLLHLPEHIIPFSTIVIGYPQGDPVPKDKWKPENISYEYFDATQSIAQPSAEKPFEEFDVTEDFHGNPFTYFKGKGLLLAAGDSADYNEMTIGWGAMGNIWERGMSMLTVYVAPWRHTYRYVEKARYFTVMEFDEAHKDILAYMGSHSGRDGNKAEALGLHTLYTEHGTPYFEEAKTVFECEMIYHAPFDPSCFGDMPATLYADFPAGIHSMYMGKIVKAMRR